MAGSAFASTIPSVFGGPSTLVNSYTVKAGESMYVYQHIYEGVFSGINVSFRANIVYRAKSATEVPIPAYGN